MFWKDSITLVDVSEEPDDDGYKTKMHARRDVFADKKTAKRIEFYEARKSGISIDIVFVVRAADYRGESQIEYTQPGDKKPTAFTVVRAYTKDGEIYELNCSRADPATRRAEGQS